MRMTDDEWLELRRAEAAKHNPTLAKIIEAYYEETNDHEFFDYMQYMIDAYMMHDCKLGRSPTPRVATSNERTKT